MRKAAIFRFAVCLVLMVSLFAPLAVLAVDGKKNFKEGLMAEAVEDWERAAELFALAVSDNPKNAEYRLHYTRALFNASQLFIRKGAELANEKDYKGGYDAFRKAYAYDPTNELARSEMERMARLFRESNGGGTVGQTNAAEEPKLVKTSFGRQPVPVGFVPQKLDELQYYGPFPGGIDLQQAIRDLARSLDLNVIFDGESFRNPQKINIELKGVTAAKALDYIFLQQNLFFQKIGPRTIMVANTTQRQKFQQLVLRTFYLSNASPKDVETLIRTVIPAQPGRTPTIAIKDDATNSITIRDTAENIELMGQLIKSLDKDRAEVVMDVSIYEVSKSDLLKLGNQIGTETQLSNLGGTTAGVVGLGGNDLFGSIGRTAAQVVPRVFGVGITLPTANLSAFQNRQNTKLLASTQIHAFNNEDSSARIGQRVPVRTASISDGFNNNTGTGNQNPAGFLSDVINYEQVGLTLKFKPLVFPNQDVQVAMEIESKDVVACATSTGNPCFSERTIKGTARVQNNKTLMLASVAQDSQADGRSGVPLLGLIPVLGRLFTAPSKDNRQVDIIIAVTPRVIRAPSILPEDEIERPTGSLAVPTNGSLEAMVYQEELDEYLANSRRLGNNTAVQLPDQNNDAPQYVRTMTVDPNATTPVIAAPTTDPVTTGDGADEGGVTESTTEGVRNGVTLRQTSLTNDASIKPIDSGPTRRFRVMPTGATPEDSVLPKPVSLPIEDAMPSPGYASKTSGPRADIQLLPAVNEMKLGEKTKIAVLVKSGTPFRSAVLGFKYDASKIAVRSVSFGDVFAADSAGRAVTPYLNQNGKTFVSLSSARNTAENTSGVLAFIEIEALADGVQRIDLEPAVMSIMTADGKSFAIGF